MVFLEACFALVSQLLVGITFGPGVSFLGEFFPIVCISSSRSLLTPVSLHSCRMSSSSSMMVGIGVLDLVLRWCIRLEVLIILGAVMSTEVDVGVTL